MTRVAALYVDPRGPYYGLPDVEPWGLPERDAREYAGPWPVVAHPPCARWGSYWYGGPLLAKQGRRLKLGDDDGCFASALAAVRRWGGVLEHPAYSRAWRWFGIAWPFREGWIACDEHGGWTAQVDQGRYGHRAAKATWLYAVGGHLPALDHRRIHTGVMASPYHSAAERQEARRSGKALEVLGHRERRLTPLPFRDLLLDIARSAAREETIA